MPSRPAQLACLALLLLAAQPVSATSTAEWRPAKASVEIPQGDPLTAPLEFSPAQRGLFADIADGHLGELLLVDAALVACGVIDATELDRHRGQFASARDELLRTAADRGLPRGNHQTENEKLQQAELVHRILHQCLLRGDYDADATDLATTLDTGIYNCASATLLFVALAGELGLDAHAVELPGHVRAVVDRGSRQFEIEVTCPGWRGAVRDVGSRGSGSAGNRRDVSPLGLLAMIYYNRGIDAFNDRRFAQAVALNRRALLLDPENRTARGNLLAAVNNWALALCDARQFAAAESLLAAGQQFDPGHLPFTQNAAHVQRLWNQSHAKPSPTAQQAMRASSAL